MSETFIVWGPSGPTNPRVTFTDPVAAGVAAESMAQKHGGQFYVMQAVALYAGVRQIVVEKTDLTPTPKPKPEKPAGGIAWSQPNDAQVWPGYALGWPGNALDVSYPSPDVAVPKWICGKAYPLGTVVSHNGDEWRFRGGPSIPTTAPNCSLNWEKVEIPEWEILKGKRQEPGALVRHKNSVYMLTKNTGGGCEPRTCNCWRPVRDFRLGDLYGTNSVVRYGGKYWLCLQAGSGQEPHLVPSHWEPIHDAHAAKL